MTDHAAAADRMLSNLLRPTTPHYSETLRQGGHRCRRSRPIKSDYFTKRCEPGCWQPQPGLEVATCLLSTYIGPRRAYILVIASGERTYR
jgi:hypothetical protein